MKPLEEMTLDELLQREKKLSNELQELKTSNDKKQSELSALKQKPSGKKTEVWTEPYLSQMKNKQKRLQELTEQLKELNLKSPDGKQTYTETFLQTRAEKESSLKNLMNELAILETKETELKAALQFWLNRSEKPLPQSETELLQELNSCNKALETLNTL